MVRSINIVGGGKIDYVVVDVVKLVDVMGIYERFLYDFIFLFN